MTESLQQLSHLRLVVGELFGSSDDKDGAPKGDLVTTIEELDMVAQMINGL